MENILNEGTNIIAVVLFIWNVAVFVLYGADKFAAKQSWRRVRERTLLLTAAFMGAPGALLAMLAFRHKTLKPAFKYGVPLLLALNIAVGYVIQSVWVK